MNESLKIPIVEIDCQFVLRNDSLGWEFAKWAGHELGGLYKQGPEVISRFLVSGIDVAPLHPSGHQGSVGVLDDQVGDLLGRCGISFRERLVTANGFVMTVPRRGIGNHFAIADDQVRSNDDPYVVNLQTLARVNTSHLLNRFLSNDPETAVLV